MVYKHKIVNSLARLIDRHAESGIAGVGKRYSLGFIIKPFWSTFKNQIPGMLKNLDNNEEAIAEIHWSIMEELDIKPPDGYRWLITSMSIELAPEEIPVVETEAPGEKEGKAEVKKKRRKAKKQQ